VMRGISDSGGTTPNGHAGDPHGANGGVNHFDQQAAHMTPYACCSCACGRLTYLRPSLLFAKGGL
jgi:hypothetical protein